MGDFDEDGFDTALQANTTAWKEEYGRKLRSLLHELLFDDEVLGGG